MDFILEGLNFQWLSLVNYVPNFMWHLLVGWYKGSTKNQQDVSNLQL
jgi:hypothetical protein